jgi:hypothetical protein
MQQARCGVKRFTVLRWDRGTSVGPALGNRVSHTFPHTVHTYIQRKSILGMAPRIFNKIPDKIISLDIRNFKKQLTLFLIDKCYYSINYFFNDNDGKNMY